MVKHLSLLLLLSLTGCETADKALEELRTPQVVWGLPQMNALYAPTAEVLAVVALADSDTPWGDLQGEWLLDGVQVAIAGIDPSNGSTTWNYGIQPIGDYELGFVVTDPDGHTSTSTVSIHVTEVDSDGDGVVDGDDCDPLDGAVYLDGAWYPDLDGDGLGDTTGMVLIDCGPLAQTANNNLDCDDTDPVKGEKGTWYLDKDGDGLGNPNELEECGPGYQLVENADDCDDTDANRVVVGLWYRDADGDGFGNADDSDDCGPPLGYVENGDDCDDSVTLAFPGGIEICDGADNDCNGAVDDYTTDGTIWYSDADGDGHGDPSIFAVLCEEPLGGVLSSDDCDDQDPLIYTGAVEYCPEAGKAAVDSNCDGTAGAPRWWTDIDGDGYGNPASLVGAIGCEDPSVMNALVAPNDQDCDDSFANINPAMDELCDPNNVDENCDGVADDSSAVNLYTWYTTDLDGDGYGDADITVLACENPLGPYPGDVLPGGDCDDTRLLIHPGVVESCNLVDDDCNGAVDDNASDADSWLEDLDQDSYGNKDEVVLSCSQPVGYVAQPTDPSDVDCDESNPDISPGDPEVCDDFNVDENCDGTPEDGTASGQKTYYWDGDGDGYAAAGAATYMACDALANYVEATGDCDDSNGGAWPRTGYTDTCDATDNDCDGTADEDAAGDVYEPNDSDTAAAVLTPVATGQVSPNITGSITVSSLNFTQTDTADWYKINWVDGSNQSNLKFKVELIADTGVAAEIWVDNNGVRTVKPSLTGTGTGVAAASSTISGSGTDTNEFAVLKVTRTAYQPGNCALPYTLTIKTYNN